MSANFKKFVSPKKCFRPKASIRRKSGILAFSKGFLNKFNLGGCHYVSLFYDEEQKKIAVKFDEIKEDGSIELKSYGSNPTQVTIKAINFLDYYSIDYSVTIPLLGELDEESGLVILVETTKNIET